MRVILLQDVRDLGKKWEVKDVPDGYARNLLLARKLAWPATPENLNKRNLLIKSEVETLAKLKLEAQKLAQEPLIFKLKSDGHGSVFDSVKKSDIEKALADRGYEVKEIKLKSPLKKLGEHWVEVSLGKGIEVKIPLLIQPS